MSDKSVPSAVNVPQAIQTENSINGLPDSLIPSTGDKLGLSVNNAIQSQEDLDLMSGSHIEPVHYSEHCTSSTHVESVSYSDSCMDGNNMKSVSYADNSTNTQNESISYSDSCTNSSNIESVSYTDHCSFSGTQDSVVLEIMAPAGDLASTTADENPSFSLMDQESTSLQDKCDRSEECVESLTILEFMLDNVTD